jgi:prepilin-type N-terminal cleavage/methylation domain-containing protein
VVGGTCSDPAAGLDLSAVVASIRPRGAPIPGIKRSPAATEPTCMASSRPTSSTPGAAETACVPSRRRRDDQGGFTLIELMVTVLIVGILITIALPTFLGARQRALNRAAQADLRTAMTAAEVYYATRRTFVGFTAGGAGTAEAIEPSLTWVANGPGIGQIRIGGNGAANQPSATSIMLVARTSDTPARYFCIKDVSTTGTFYRSGAAFANVDTLAECNQASW